MLSMTRWSPWDELENLHRAVDRTVGRRWSDESGGLNRAWVPATEVTSDKEGWTVRMALPGIDPKQVQIDVHGDVLTVKGERTSRTTDSHRHLSELGYGVFERTFTLPANVEAGAVTASFEHGMLELRLPVKEESKPRRIEIGTTVTKAA